MWNCNKCGPLKERNVSFNETCERCGGRALWTSASEKSSITCVKPDPRECRPKILTGVTEGTHPPYGQSYIRQVTVPLEWSSLKERLPPKSTHERTYTVLLYVPDSICIFITGHGVMRGTEGVNIPYTISYYEDNNSHRIFSTPTHWMPLPGPPKGE